jgi:hypothetical protein
MFLSALVATCPTILLPDEYSRAREVLRPGSDATEDDLRAVACATLAALGKGEWNADQRLIVEVALDPVLKFRKQVEREAERQVALSSDTEESDSPETARDRDVKESQHVRCSGPARDNTSDPQTS